jgi:polygalacturonase
MTIYWFGDPDNKGNVGGIAVRPANSNATSTTIVTTNHAVLSVTAVAMGDENKPYPKSPNWIKLPDGSEINGNQWKIVKDYVINELRVCTVDRPVTDGVLELAPKLEMGTVVKRLSNLSRTWQNYTLVATAADANGNTSLIFEGPAGIDLESGSPILTLDNKYVASEYSRYGGGMVGRAYPGVYGGVDPITWGVSITPVPAPVVPTPQPVPAPIPVIIPPPPAPPVINQPITQSVITQSVVNQPITQSVTQSITQSVIITPIVTPSPVVNTPVISNNPNIKPASSEDVVNKPSSQASNIIVQTIANLIVVDPNIYKIAETLGYYTVNDGGRGLYVWTNDDSNTNNGSKIKSSLNGAWILVSDTINVLQWGAKNDGSSDASGRINEAIAYASNSKFGIKEIYIPRGEYAIGSPVSINQSNIHIKLHGTLRNINGINSSVLEVYTRVNATIVNGVPSYQLENISIDGDNIGVIDQNSQNATPWDFEHPEITKAYHALFVFSVNNLSITNLTVKNGIMWTVCAELCKNVMIQNNKVYNGFCNNRRVNGVYRYLGGQDGIHAVDCISTQILNNYVESGDDAVAVTATRTLAKDAVVSNNICWSKVFAYEKDGVTLNNNSVPGRYALAVYCEAIGQYCGLENVIVSNNIVPGGQGLFGCYDIDDRTGNISPHTGTLNGVKFIGNSFNNINSAGNPAVNPSVQLGWIIQGGTNIEFIGNSFSNIARWGSISSGENPINVKTNTGTVFFKSNRFTNFNVPPINIFNGQTPAIIWLATGHGGLILENNTFENNNILCVSVGGTGDLTPNQFTNTIINQNTFINNKSDVEVYGSNVVRFTNNIITQKTGTIIKIRSFKSVKITDNTIIGNGNGNFNDPNNVFNVANSPGVGFIENKISDNSVFDSINS